MDTKNIPTIVMLAAALTTSIVMYVNDYDLGVTLKMILIVFLAFYILGAFVKWILDKVCPKETDADEDGENGEESESAEGEQGSEDGSVIEKK